MTKAEASTVIKTWYGAMKKTYGNNGFALEFIEAANTAVAALEKLSEIEEAITFCEGCECYHGIREYSESQCYEDIKEIIYE